MGMTSGQKQLAELRRQATLQATTLSTREKEDIKRRREASRERNRMAAVEASRANSTHSELQTALQRRRVAVDAAGDTDVKALARDADAKAPARDADVSSTLTAAIGGPGATSQAVVAGQARHWAEPLAPVTLGTEAREDIHRRRVASIERRHVVAAEAERMSAAKCELQAVLERQRAVVDESDIRANAPSVADGALRLPVRNVVDDAIKPANSLGELPQANPESGDADGSTLEVGQQTPSTAATPASSDCCYDSKQADHPETLARSGDGSETLGTVTEAEGVKGDWAAVPGSPPAKKLCCCVIS